MNIAIVGATGNVGRKILEVLEKKEISIDNLYLVASPKSVVKKIKFHGKEIEVNNLENFDFSKVKIAFFAAGGKISIFQKLRSLFLLLEEQFQRILQKKQQSIV